MKSKINNAIASVSPQALCAGDLCPAHELAAIGIGWAESIDLEAALEHDLEREIPDGVYESWVTVGDIYSFYGAA